MPDFDNRTGAEELQLAIYRAIYIEINNYLAREEGIARSIDDELQQLTGRGIAPVTLERFQPENIHFGHRPSMIEAPVEEYPSLSVMTYDVSADPSNPEMDFGNALLIECAIEAIVKSGPYPSEDRGDNGEDLVGRRIKRTAEAIFALLDDNRSELGFYPPKSAPRIRWGDLFALHDEEYNERYYWQGVRITVRYPKQTVFSG